MKLPRVRFTLRRMMVATAIIALTVAVIVGLPRRSEGFRRRANFYGQQIVQVGRGWRPATPTQFAWQRKQWYCYDMMEKYEFAADNPWLPVWPDPPEPE